MEQAWRMKAVRLQQDRRASNHASGAEKQQGVPRSASELRPSCLRREGGRESVVYLMKMTIESDSALFWLLPSFLLFLLFFF